MTAQKTFASTNEFRPPSCYFCGNTFVYYKVDCQNPIHFGLSGRTAIVRCLNGCFPGVAYMCQSCDIKVHSSSAIHIRHSFCNETHGFFAAPPISRPLQLCTCTVCNAAFNGGGSRILPELIRTVTHATARGHVELQVIPVQCNHCGSIVGRNSTDYNCIDGAKDVWFDRELVEMDYRYYLSSNFSLTRRASGKALALSNDAHGCPTKHRVLQDALSRARR